MAIEIERKFLVLSDKLPPLSDGQRFRQGYLSRNPQVRFRVVDDREVILCVKKTIAPRQKIEFEFPRGDMSPGEIDALCALALWPALMKTRHRLPFDGLVWEVDVYGGRNKGLVTADVELPNAKYTIRFPEWIDAGSEISGLKKYSNVQLTRRPFREW